MDNNNQNNGLSWSERIQALDHIPGEILDSAASWELTLKKMKRSNGSKNIKKWYWIAAAIFFPISLLLVFRSLNSKTTAIDNRSIPAAVILKADMPKNLPVAPIPTDMASTDQPAAKVREPGSNKDTTISYLGAKRTTVPELVLVNTSLSGNPADSSVIAQVNEQLNPPVIINKPLPIISINKLLYHNNGDDEIAVKNYHLRNLFRPNDERQSAQTVAIDLRKNKLLNKKDSSQN